MPKPTEHKTVQARILAYAEAIGWTFVLQKAGFVLRLRRAKAVFVLRLCRAKGSCRRGLNHKERRDHKGVSHSESLSSLRLPISEFKGFDRRERRDRREDLDGAEGFGETSRGKFFDHEEKRERDLILITSN